MRIACQAVVQRYPAGVQEHLLPGGGMELSRLPVQNKVAVGAIAHYREPMPRTLHSELVREARGWVERQE